MFCLHGSLGFKDFLIHIKNYISPNRVSRLHGASGLVNMGTNIFLVVKK